MNLSPTSKILLVILIVAFGILSRFLPHAANFTPLIALILFTSSYIGLRYSLPVLFGIMFISDFFIGFYQWQVMVAVYGSFIISSCIGSYLKKRTVQTVVVSTLSSSLIFFFVTNWAVWQFGTLYAHSFSGLVQSYVAALPFFRNALAGDFFYATVLFGAMYALSVSVARKYHKRRVYQVA